MVARGWLERSTASWAWAARQALASSVTLVEEDEDVSVLSVGGADFGAALAAP